MSPNSLPTTPPSTAGSEAAGGSDPASRDAAPPAHSGRDALLVFVGTMAVTAMGLMLLIFWSPELFGLAPKPAAAGSGDAGLPTAQDGAASTSQGATTARAPQGHGSSDRRGEFVDPAGSDDSAGAMDDTQLPAGLDGISSPGLGEFMGEEAGIPFAPRPGIGESGPFQRRPTVLRVPVAPTLAQRIFDDGKASVVHVRTFSITSSANPNAPSIDGWGSGLIWDRSGHIVTSRHVIENVQGAHVTTADGISRPAKLIGFDDASDIAVLRIDAPPESLTPIRVGTSGDLSVGMTVFSLACPYGLEHSLTTGLVSGLDRSIGSTRERTLSGTIQTDAPISPGSSGGALIDDQGRVIGMNAAIHRDSERAPGVGFALPIDRLQSTVPTLIRRGIRWYREFGFVTDSDIGRRRRLRSADASMEGSKLPAAAPLRAVGPPSVPVNGLVITEVDPGSGADRAGLRGLIRRFHAAGMVDLHLGDVIVAASDEPISSSAELARAIALLGPTEPLRLGIARRGGTVTVIVERSRR